MAATNVKGDSDTGRNNQKLPFVIIEIGTITDAYTLAEGLRAWAEDHQEDASLAARISAVEELLAVSSGSVDLIILNLRCREGLVTESSVQSSLHSGGQILRIDSGSEPELAIALLTASAVYRPRDRAVQPVKDTRESTALESKIELDHATARPRPALSARERDVLQAYASGLTVEAVARLAGISPGTVKTYLGRIKTKYSEVGRPAYTKLDLAARVKEDWL